MIDDHKLVRQGIRMLVESEPDLKVVGEAGDGPQGLMLLEDLQPDIAIIDLMMPGMIGMEVIKQAARVSPNTKSIVLSMYSDDIWVLGALEAGSSGYVLKDSSSEDLVNAIRTVVEGKRFLSRPISMEKLEAYKASLHSDE